MRMFGYFSARMQRVYGTRPVLVNGKMVRITHTAIVPSLAYISMTYLPDAQEVGWVDDSMDNFRRDARKVRALLWLRG